MRSGRLTNRRRACTHAAMQATPARALRHGSGGAPTGAGDAKEPLQVRIPVAVKRRFKAHAAMRGLEPNELFVEIWEHYEATVRSANEGADGNRGS